MDNYHITKKGEEWKFGKQGSNRAIASTDTKAEAIKEMRDYMQDHAGSVKIHKESGRIQEERTYPGANDPKKSPG